MEYNRKTTAVDKAKWTVCCDDIIFWFYPLFVILSDMLYLESTVILHYLANIFCHVQSTCLLYEGKPIVPDPSQILLTNTNVHVK
jgi:hypothetical protein